MRSRYQPNEAFGVRCCDEPAGILPPSTLSEERSDAKSAELAQCEATITRGLRSFVESQGGRQD